MPLICCSAPDAALTGVLLFGTTSSGRRSPTLRLPRGLTPRSSGPTAACHQGPVGGTLYIFAHRALASRRCGPLTSNVRPRPHLHQGLRKLVLRPPPIVVAFASPPEQPAPAPEAYPAYRRLCLRTPRPVPGAFHPLFGTRCGAFRRHESRHHLKQSPVPYASATARPNPSVKRTHSGMPPGPGHRYAVHFLWPGPGVMPLRSAYLQR